jgi:hypothetical protein
MNIKDPIWRLNNLYSVVSKSGKKVPFKQNSVQKILNTYTQKRRRILKARQMGVSTNELIKMLDFVLFNKNKTAVIIAHESDAIEKLFRIVRRAYEFIPENLKPELDRGQGSKYEMFFPKNNSRIYCDLESRGDTIHYLHVSEKAFIKELSRVYATTEAVPIDGVITEESTANGLNHFYDSWVDPESNYTNIFFPWFFHEEYKIDNHDLTLNKLTDDERKFIKFAKERYNIDISLPQIDFRRFKQRELKKVFPQEYSEDNMSCFLTSGGNPFDLAIIKKLYDDAPDPIKTINGLRIYKEREPNQVYVIGADTAEGIDGDNSAAHVFKVSTREQVASFHGKVKPSEFAEKLVEIAELYQSKYKNEGTFEPLIGVERNNHGHAVLLKLEEYLHYPSIFKMGKDQEKLGWITDKVTRPIMVDTFIEGVENGTIKLNDKQTLAECLTLVSNNGKIEAETGKHDDLFIAACISIQLSIEESALDIYSNDVRDLIKI